MPFYAFKCRTCGLEKEELRTMGDFTEPLCPECQYNHEAQGKYERMKKMVSMVSPPRFKGTGFYETDYKNRQGDFQVLGDANDSAGRDGGVTAKRVRYKGTSGKSVGNG